MQWRERYLHTLAQRPKWLELHRDRNFQIHDLVPIMEDNFAPTIWPLARITEVHPGHDGLVRLVTLRTAAGRFFKRPITKLNFLSIQDEVSSSQNEVQYPL